MTETSSYKFYYLLYTLALIHHFRHSNALSMPPPIGLCDDEVMLIVNNFKEIILSISAWQSLSMEC